MIDSSSAPANLFSPFAPTHSVSSLRRCHVISVFVSSKKPLRHDLRSPTYGLRLFASIPHRRGVQSSWLSPELNSGGDFGGWAVSDPPIRSRDENRGIPSIVIGGVGASLVFLVSTIAYLSLSKRGVKIRISSPLDGVPIMVDSRENESLTIACEKSDRDTHVSEPSSGLESNAARENVTSERVERVIIHMAVDSTQRKALSVLKKLKILEDEVKADELCTRREYCRWLVRMNTLLERDPRHRIIPQVSPSWSTKLAFDDISIDDVDFASIQALAEAGVISSKLSQSSVDAELEESGCVYFSPNSFVSRLDLIDWKAQLDYEIGVVDSEQMMTTKVGFLDMKRVELDAYPGLFKDTLAGDKGIIRKVFGRSKRLQPNKPSTKAQAAVALTSGRMAEAISYELSRLEDERSARQAEMEALWSEMLERGDIKRPWDEKLIEEKARCLEAEKKYLSAVSDLEKERIVLEKHFADKLKEKAAMECQRQLLLSLNEEVNDISEKLATERTLYVAEQCNLRKMIGDLESKQEGILDTKSILEAEIEAIRILRSWVEDEARKSQARAKVLEDVERRWKWGERS